MKKKRMHLIDLSQFYVPECRIIRTYITAKSRWLAQHPHIRHTIIAPGDAPSTVQDGIVRTPGIRLPCFPGFRLSQSRRAVEFLIKSLHPDCIEVSDPFQFARAAIHLKQDCPVLIGAYCHFTPARIMLHPFTSESRIIRALSRLYRRFDLLLVSSLNLLGKFREHGLEHARYLPPGVDTTVFHPSAADPAMRDRLGLKEKTKLLAYVEYTPEPICRKLLLETMHHLDSTYHLLVIGSNPKSADTEKISYFYFNQHTHPSEQLATLIASCDALVHPELHQNYPLSVLEGMACALPVAGFNSGAFVELVDETCGVAVNTVCPKKLANAITCICENRKTMGSAARKKMKNRHDWRALLTTWHTCYTNLMANRKPTCPVKPQNTPFGQAQQNS
ncbi:MAG: glycosyltransferase [Alistipes senegalensis]|nr:glycosyltransferase [Oxalobacter formigenes]MCM1281433.1 glycosyltransferase [Alistipes senegalensis]